MRHTLTIEYGDDILFSLGLTPEEFSGQVRLLTAARLYEQGRLTAGQAAKFCGMERPEFLMALAGMGVPACNIKGEEAEAEIKFGRNG